MLFSEPKIPQFTRSRSSHCPPPVSVLFSEPKIPQYNKSVQSNVFPEKFQCSSASRKFLNWFVQARRGRRVVCFSALQRAENSSILKRLQRMRTTSSFSALQRAENSSIRRDPARTTESAGVSVLFSEPKIPQSGSAKSYSPRSRGFSALQRAENSSIQGKNR